MTTSTPRSPRDPVQMLLKARMRQQAHDLRAAGVSKREIVRQLDVSRSTVEDWLLRPRPTEDEIKRLEEHAARPKTAKSGCVPFRIHFDPVTHHRLVEEAERQGAPRTRVVDLAVELYCDAMARLRGEIEGPINVKGYQLNG